MDVKRIFKGENQYTTGLMFMFATLTAFFIHMKKLEFKIYQMFVILLFVSTLAFLVSLI